MKLHTRRAGDRGLLVELEGVSAQELHHAAQQLERLLEPVATITGHSSVLLLFRDEPPAVLPDISLAGAASGPARVHRIGVSFAPEDAPDLSDALSHLNITRDEFVSTLTSSSLHVRFLGFLPGFAYLEGLPPGWNLPRRPTSRTRVPSGSLGIAAGMAGFYPADVPGGWNLVGRTSRTMWDPRRDPPNLLSPGDTIMIEEAAIDRLRSDVSPAVDDPAGEAVARVLSPGQFTLITRGQPDRSRYRFGLPPGGAFDPAAAARANHHAGNDADAGVLECVFVGPELQFDQPCEVACEGGEVDWYRNEARIADRIVSVKAGDILRVGRITQGLRCWIAVSGGLRPTAARYSGAPSRLTKGEVLRRDERESHDLLERPMPARETSGDTGRLDVIAGPHDCPQLEELIAQPWRVSQAIDRTGIRLHPIERAVTAPSTIPSQGLQIGSVQLHPSGDLIVMGVDHPVTGGYLQPFTVVSSNSRKLAQLAPGQTVRFRVIS